MDALFRIEMLGRFAVFQGNREITRFRTRKTASLLAYLTLYRSGLHLRESLIACFWPDYPVEDARDSLSVALTALRRQLEPPGVARGAVLITDNTRVCLNPLAFTSDVEDFESLLQEAQIAAEAEKRMDLYRSALELYRGELLPGHFEEWMLAERDRLRDAYLVVLRQVIKALAESRQLEQALIYAHRLVQADPLREESYRHLMRLYGALDRPEEALSCYQALERRLQKELQTTPSSATQTLAESLQQVSAPLLNARKAQAADTQPDKAIAAALSPPDTKRPAYKVPLQFTRFYGQEEAISYLVQTLSLQQEATEGGDTIPSVSGSRLVTLTGPGGAGKTRLSIEVAGRVKQMFPGGIWFMALADLNDPLLVGEAIRNVLELAPAANVSTLEQVITFLNGLQQPCLLILDNLEQIAAGGASVVWTLLKRTPLLQCLVTSRHPLSLSGERAFPIGLLPTPVLEASVPASSLRTTHLLTYPSVALFVDRAQSARPDFQITPGNAQVIAAACQKLEGIPLAIELAAARVKTLTPAQIEERLSERFELLASRKTDKGERHRTLWAAIDWSYHLLSPGLQRLFARLSVFRGGWSLEAAEAVCQEPLALDYLGQLQSHSLILAEEGAEAIRFRMLDTIREFAEEMLTPEDRDGLRNRHRDYFLPLAEGTEVAFFSAEQAPYLQRLEQEHDNLRAALQRCLDDVSGGAIKGLQMILGLYQFWHHRGYWNEGRLWFERVLVQASTEEPTKLQARALCAAAYLASEQGDYDEAKARYEQALEFYRQIGDRVGSATPLGELGWIAYLRGDWQTAEALLKETLQLDREGGDKSRVAATLTNIGSLLSERGEHKEAQSLYEEALAINREVGNRAWEAISLNSLGNLAYSLEQSQEARALYEQSLAIQREIEDKQGISISLNNLGSVASMLKDVAAARAYYEESLALRRELGDRLGLSLILGNLGTLVCEQGDYAAARDYLLQSLTLCLELDSRRNAVHALEGMANLAEAQGQAGRSVCLLAASHALRDAISYNLPSHGQENQDQDLKTLRAALGEEAFTAAWKEGLAMTLDQAAAVALAGETAF